MATENFATAEMDNASAYIPQDRRRSLAQGRTLPEETQGAALFADISGFTLLTDALVQHYGPRRGVDEFTRRLNAVYSALIAEVDRFGGSVIGFSGDGIICWFAAEFLSSANDDSEASGSPVSAATLAALASALAMQAAMAAFHTLTIGDAGAINLAIKTAVAAGRARRFLVGDPQIQFIDVLAGATLDRMAAAEQRANKHELLVDADTLTPIQDNVLIQGWRGDPQTGLRFAIVEGLNRKPQPVRDVAEAQPVPADLARPWVLPAIYPSVQSAQSRFLAGLRPAAALFLKFSGLDFDHDPSAGAKIDAYIRWVQAVVDRYEGALIQLTTGDKGSYLYAAFGAPVAHDDDILRAVAAALDLRTPPATMPFITATQIGVSQGMMRVGAYGSPNRRTYGVLSDETIVAARLMSQAAPGQILVSAPVAEAVHNHYQLYDIGSVKLKGKPEAQPVWSVLGRQGQTGEQRSRRYTAPLVGRRDELATLRPTLTALLDGQGQLLRIEGSAGVGKSHLVTAFAQEAAERGFEIVAAACQSTSQDIAYFSGRQLARNLLHLAGDATLAETVQIDQLASALAALNTHWLLRMPLLGDLLGLSIPDNPTTAAFDPRLRQEALISLVVDIVQARAGQHPLVILFEDIHWMDEASQGILLALARIAQNTPLLLVMVQRPSSREDERFLAEVAALPGQIHLFLNELSADGLAALVRNRLQGEIAPLALALIQRQTQGNPFFAEELVDALRDARHLVADNHMWTLAPSLVETLRNAGCLRQVDEAWTLAPDAPLAGVDLGIPNTVQGIVLARLDRLPEPAKLTLKVASVIGAVFEYELLAQAHPLPNIQGILHEHTALFLAREFARLETPEPQLTYIFKHNITQEVVYQSLLEDQRHELHLSVATVLERLHAERVEDLAFHYVNCNITQRPVRDRALYYLDAAGQRAKRDYANETALNYFNRALAIEARWPWLKAKIEVLHILGRRDEEHLTLQKLQASPNASAFDTLLLWGEYYEAISEYEQAQQAVKQALVQARLVTDQEGEARCYTRLGMVAWRQGDYETAEQVYNKALAILNHDAQFLDEEAAVRYGLGLVYRQQGKYDEARIQFEHDLALNRELGNREQEARALNAMGSVEYMRRNFDEALQYCEKGLSIQREIGDRAGIGASLLNIAQILSNLGDHSKTEVMLREALKMQQTLNNRWWEANTWNELGILYLMIGNLTESKRCLQQGLTISQEIGAETLQAHLLCNLGQVLRDSSQWKQAENHLRQGLQLAESQGDVQLQAICFNDLALLCLQRKQYTAAIEYARLSLEKFDPLDLEVSTTSVLAVLASAQQAIGNHAQALATAYKAVHILDTCGGEGPDFPQRDYWMCYEVLHSLNEPAMADHALKSAYRLLLERAERITDPHMRVSFLENISFHHSIIQAAK